MLAMRRLKSELVVRRTPDASLIEVGVIDHTTVNWRPDIANKIAEVFESERLRGEKAGDPKGNPDKLRDDVAQQEDRVHAVQEKIERLRKELGVPVLGNVKLGDITMEHLESEVSEARNTAVTSEARLNEIRKAHAPTTARRHQNAH